MSSHKPVRLMTPDEAAGFLSVSTRTLKRLVAEGALGGLSGANGLAMNVKGNLSVCDAGNGCVWMFSKWGKPLFRIRSCTGGRTTTNLVYGGPNNKTLFITESYTGTILQTELPTEGSRMFGLI